MNFTALAYSSTGIFSSLVRLAFGVGLFLVAYVALYLATEPWRIYPSDILPKWEYWIKYVASHGQRYYYIGQAVPVFALLFFSSLIVSLKMGWTKTRLLVTSMIFLAAFGVSFRQVIASRLDDRHSALVSDQNHMSILNFQISQWQRGSPQRTLPYQETVPGYVMLARFSAKHEGHVNCNHSAPGARIGGWQAVNLSPETWRKVEARWPHSRFDHSIPFYWCGEPNGLEKRAVTTVFRFSESSSTHWQLEDTVIRESVISKMISELRSILRTLDRAKAEQLTMDIPAKVAWESFEIPGNEAVERSVMGCWCIERSLPVAGTKSPKR